MRVVQVSEDGLVTNDVPDEVRHLILKWIDVAEGRLTLDASLIDLGADSLAMVDLLLDVEATFEIEIPDDEAAKILTVGDAIGAVEKLVRAQRPA
jgi:acyl carrier protein